MGKMDVVKDSFLVFKAKQTRKRKTVQFLMWASELKRNLMIATKRMINHTVYQSKLSPPFLQISNLQILINVQCGAFHDFNIK